MNVLQHSYQILIISYFHEEAFVWILIIST